MRITNPPDPEGAPDNLPHKGSLCYHSGGPVSGAGGTSLPNRITFISMNLRSLFSMFSSDLAIDLGTANTLVLSLIHISEPTRLGMISYAVFCLKKKKKT